MCTGESNKQQISFLIIGLFATFAEAGPALLGGLAAGGAAGGGLGGLGIGAGTKKWFPRKWFGEKSTLRKAMKRIEKSLKDNFGEEVGTSNNNATLPVNSTVTHNTTASSPSNVEIATENTTTTPDNEASTPPENTSTLSDHVSPTQNNTAPISGSIVADATISNSTAGASDLITPTYRAEATEFNTNNYSYLPQVAVNAVNTIRNLFWNFRLR